MSLSPSYKGSKVCYPTSAHIHRKASDNKKMPHISLRHAAHRSLSLNVHRLLSCYSIKINIDLHLRTNFLSWPLVLVATRLGVRKLSRCLNNSSSYWMQSWHPPPSQSSQQKRHSIMSPPRYARRG